LREIDGSVGFFNWHQYANLYSATKLTNQFQKLHLYFPDVSYIVCKHLWDRSQQVFCSMWWLWEVCVIKFPWRIKFLNLLDLNIALILYYLKCTFF